MSYRKLDVEEIQMPKYLAVLDIKRRDAENIGLYDNDDTAQAEHSNLLLSQPGCVEKSI